MIGLLKAAVRYKSSELSHTLYRGSGVFVPSAPLPRTLWASPLRAFHYHPQQTGQRVNPLLRGGETRCRPHENKIRMLGRIMIDECKPGYFFNFVFLF